MKYWAQTNNKEDEANRILSSSRITEYGIDQIKAVDQSYPGEIDFATPLASGMLTDADLKFLAPKKRTRGPNKTNKDLQDAHDRKKRLSQ